MLTIIVMGLILSFLLPTLAALIVTCLKILEVEKELRELKLDPKFMPPVHWNCRCHQASELSKEEIEKFYLEHT